MVFLYVVYLSLRNGHRLITLDGPDITSIVKSLSARDQFFREKITLNQTNKMFFGLSNSDYNLFSWEEIKPYMNITLT